MADSSSSQYDKESKRECRSRLIEHAVRCLTEERSESVCVKREHVDLVWKQLVESGKADDYFTEEDRQEINEEIRNWKSSYDGHIKPKERGDLHVCYLCGENPINDLDVLRTNGVDCRNVWAFEKNSEKFETARNKIKDSEVRNFKLYNIDILEFLKYEPQTFDIIYLDCCGALSAQDTLKIIGYVFLYDKLTSPGALITNFSFPPQQENCASSQDKGKEREKLNFLAKKYMNYRLCNVSGQDNSPENNAEYPKKREDEDIYGDYVSYQVIDSAYLFIPAQRMLSTITRRKSMWEQIFISTKQYFKEINSDDEKITETKNKKLMALREDLKEMCNVHASSSLLFDQMRKMAESFHEKSKNYSCCNSWIQQIFPDNESKPFLRGKYGEIHLLLTTLLVSSQTHIIDFYNDAFVECLKSLCKAVADDTRIPSCGDMTTPGQSTCLLAGLVYGEMAHPSFPVMDKLLRLRYTAETRQMFADVFVFDKCRYMYGETPTVHCSDSAIALPKNQMVFRMVVDGLRKHLGGICSEDLFKFCNVASKDAIVEGGVSFPNSERSIPDRQEIEQYLRLKEEAFGLVKVKEYKEAIEKYHECLSSCSVSLQYTILANIAQCFLSLGLFENVVSTCTDVLMNKTKHVKARYRRAKAFKMMGHYRRAVKDLKMVLKDDPGNKEAERVLLECRYFQMFVCDTHWFYFIDPKLSALDK